MTTFFLIGAYALIALLVFEVARLRRRIAHLEY
jgi:hypothetical protein